MHGNDLMNRMNQKTNSIPVGFVYGKWVASNTQLVGRSMRLYRASLAPTPGLRPFVTGNEAVHMTPAVGSPLTRQSEGEQRVHLAALEAKMVALNLTLADPNINGLVEVKAVFDEKRRQLDGTFMNEYSTNFKVV